MFFSAFLAYPGCASLTLWILLTLAALPQGSCSPLRSGDVQAIQTDVFEVDFDPSDKEVLAAAANLELEEAKTSKNVLDSDSLLNRLSEEFVQRWRNRRRQLQTLAKKTKGKGRRVWKRMRTSFRL